MRGVEKARSERFVRGREIFDRPRELTHDGVDQSARGEFPARKNEVAETHHLVHGTAQKPLVHPLVASAHEHEILARRGEFAHPRVVELATVGSKVDDAPAVARGAHRVERRL